MLKIKSVIIILNLFIFALVIGIQIGKSGKIGFIGSFVITFVFGLIVYFVQIITYIIMSGNFVAAGKSRLEDYQSPFDIWLTIIPFCILMMVAFIWLKWHLAHVFFSSSLSLTGMLLGNALGRGSGRWDIRKSIPFFTGVISSILFSVIMEWMV